MEDRLGCESCEIVIGCLNDRPGLFQNVGLGRSQPLISLNPNFPKTPQGHQPDSLCSSMEVASSASEDQGTHQMHTKLRLLFLFWYPFSFLFVWLPRKCLNTKERTNWLPRFVMFVFELQLW